MYSTKLDKPSYINVMMMNAHANYGWIWLNRKKPEAWFTSLVESLCLPSPRLLGLNAIGPAAGCGRRHILYVVGPSAGTGRRCMPLQENSPGFPAGRSPAVILWWPGFCRLGEIDISQEGEVNGRMLQRGTFFDQQPGWFRRGDKEEEEEECDAKLIEDRHESGEGGDLWRRFWWRKTWTRELRGGVFPFLVMISWLRNWRGVLNRRVGEDGSTSNLFFFFFILFGRLKFFG